MKDFLTEQLDRTNYWLSFSEAKNAALVALNIAIIAVCTQIDIFSMIMQVILCVLFLASTICCLISFHPNLKSETDNQGEYYTKNKNLVFYGDISKIKDANSYIDAIKYRYKLDMCEKEKNICEDLAVEIVINSKIAMSKYHLFRKAIYLDIMALVVFSLCMIIA